MRRGIVVDQAGRTDETSSSSTLASVQGSRVIAIVDRSADIQIAAKEIVRARAGFRGRSTYAPDLVLVNEFAMRSFVDTAVVALTQYLSGSSLDVGTGSAEKMKPRRRERSDVLTEEERSDSETTVILEGDNGTLVKIGNR